MRNPDFIYRSAKSAGQRIHYPDHIQIKWWIVPPRKRTTVHYFDLMRFYQWPWMLFGNLQTDIGFGAVLVYGSRYPIVGTFSSIQAVQFANTAGGATCMGNRPVYANSDPEELFFTTMFTEGGSIAPGLDGNYYSVETASQLYLGDNCSLVSHETA